MEHKVFPAIIIKVEAERGIVEAIVSVFGIVDDGADLIPNGAFKKTLAERGRQVRVLNAHNSRRIEDVIGIPLEIQEVGRNELPKELLDRFPESTGGLRTVTQYLIEDPEDKRIFTRIKTGAVSEYSIGFEAKETSYSKVPWRGKDINVRVIKQIALWEYSPVVWGMNPATMTTDVKEKDKTPMSDSKEMTAQGPVSRIGDMLQGRMRYVANAYGNDWLAMGKLTADQIKAVNQALDTAMATFVAALPEDIALMPTWGGYYYMDSADAPAGQKAMPMLPFGYPMMMIPGMVQSAPIPDSTKQAESPAESKPAATPSPKPDEAKSEEKVQAGPSVPETPTEKVGPSASATPTEDERKRVLKSIEDEMKVMEAT